MEMIFPGMDPYLEDPLIWHRFHNRFVVHLADALEERLGDRYATSVTERVYVEGPQPREISPDAHVTPLGPQQEGGGIAVAPDDTAVEVQVLEAEIREFYVEIIDRNLGEEVVTIIELASPSNKAPGEGRDSYLRKQREVLASHSHLVEMDLLRTGMHVVALPAWIPGRRGAFNYLVSVNRASGRRDRFRYYAIKLREPLPKVYVPLAKGDPDVPIDLQAVLRQTYVKGKYRTKCHYDAPCMPPLSPEDQAWADDLLRAAGVK